MDRRAFDELTSSSSSQAAYFAQSLEQQYKSLEAMAYYFGTLDDFNIVNETAVTNACVLANDLCTLGFSDLKGNAVSYEGESLGNIADRDYFIEASYWKGQRSIEYLDKTAFTNDPRILLAVPVRYDNALIGILFASKEIEVFDEILLTDNFNGQEIIFVTDSDGAFIAGNANARKHITAANLFDDHLTVNMLDGVTADGITDKMKRGEAGSFCVNHEEKEYVVYTPLGVSDWYLYSMVPSSTVNARVAANRQQFTDTIRTLAIAFCIAVFCIGAISIIQLCHESRDKRTIRQQAERYQTILGSIRGATFNYDLSNHELEVSDSFERLFGYTLPRNWYAELPQRAAAHPELDYKAISEARGKVELTLQQAETIICVDTATRGRRWFKVTLAPVLGETKHLSNIYGFIMDVTEERDEYKRMMLDRERLSLAMGILSPLVISVNLTQNSYSMVNYDDFTTKAAPNEGVFDELIEIGASTCPEPDNERFKEAFSRESLLAAYARGEKKVELEHRQLGDDGVVRWIRTWVLFVNNPYDDDIYEITLARDITESKKYEELLKKTFDLTLDNMPCYTAKWKFTDGDILLVDANQEYLDFMDISAEDAFGQSIIYGFSEQEKQKIMDVAYACEKEKKPIIFTSRAVKADGAECWIKVQASFFEDSDGCSVYYGTITDITDLITAQKELNKTIAELESANAQLLSTNTYRDLMSYSHDGGMMVRTMWRDGKCTILYVSPSLLQACGYSEEEYKKSLVDDNGSLIHPDDRERVIQANSEHTTVGDRFSLNYRMRHKDGHYIWFMEHSLIVTMPNGEAVAISISMDISEQKELEQKFRISQEEYKIAATLSNRAVLSFDIKSKSFTVISKGDSTLEFERAAKDCPEQAIREGILAPESVDTIRDVFAAIARGEQHGKVVLAVVARNGSKHWEEVVYSIIFDDAGEPLTAILAFDDVTAKKNAEALFNISSTFLNYSKNAAKLLAIDLTTKTIGYETEGPHGLLTSLVGTKDVFEVTRYTIQHLVVPEDRDACAEFFSEEHFRIAYENGVTEETFEYRGYTADNTPHWMNVQTRIVQDTYSKDIIVYVVFSDINDQKLAEFELLRRAQTDSLTGLMNRESFEEEIQARCSDPANRACELYNAIIMIDVDKFKSINDTYGHDAGDDALKEVARRIKSCLRGGDLVARFGGDEFIVLLPAMPSPELIAHRCMKICDALNYQTPDGHAVSGSLGFAVCPEDGSDFDTLLKKADTAMYQVKNNGGNGYARFNADGEQSIIQTAIHLSSSGRKKVFARTFGYFDLFVDGEPVHFPGAKEKELLAILIDRNGGTLTSEEAISILWEDEPAGEKQLARYRKTAMNLRNILQENGIDNIIVSTRGIRHIDTSKLECDYYQFLKGDVEFKKLYHGTYMTNYSWSEDTVARLDNMIERTVE